MPKSSTNGIAKSSPPNSILTNHLRSERDDSFLTGGGEMGQLMRTFDWSKTTVGPTENWPQSLRTAISMILNSSLPTFIWWGQDDLTNFYNDAYIRVLGNKHPQALGKSGRDVWQEIWNEAQLVVMHIFTTGQSIYKENLPVTIIRHNKPEQACFTYSFNPIRDESGRVGGIYFNPTIIQSKSRLWFYSTITG